MFSTNKICTKIILVVSVRDDVKLFFLVVIINLLKGGYNDNYKNYKGNVVAIFT